MNKKFKNKYRIKSIRLQSWDYSCNASYHITICTHLMKHFFGRIENDEMIYSPEGKIALDILNDLPRKFSFVKLDEFQIMPNHIHIIIIINTKKVSIDENNTNHLTENESETAPSPDGHSDLMNNDKCSRFPDSDPSDDTKIEDQKMESIPVLHQFSDIEVFEKAHSESGGITGKHNPMLYDNLSKVIRNFKGRITFEIRKINKGFKWHSRFWDKIIRNHRQLENTRKYIQNNIKNFKK